MCEEAEKNRDRTIGRTRHLWPNGNYSSFDDLEYPAIELVLRLT